MVTQESDTAILIFQRILKFLLLLLGVVLAPFIKWRALKKSKQLPQIQNRILLLPGTEIARRIRKRELTSVEVINCYIERCKDVNPILNAIVETRYDAAIQEAQRVDAFLKSTTKTEKELEDETPLLGVPVTIKESIAVQGMSHSAGVKKEIPSKADRDALVVKFLRDAGAIVLLVSNTPELCMFWESYNNVTGYTWNPYDTNRSSGGSSGGEGALLGSACSVLGVGSDVAGSARVPALYCGIFGHKPTPGWVPYDGHTPDSTHKDWDQLFTIGPMVRYATDLPLVLKVMSQSDEAQSQLSKKVSVKDIKFFYLDEEVGSGITKAVDREMKSSIHRLKRHIEESHGMKVQKAQLSDIKLSFNIGSYVLLKLAEIDSIFGRGAVTFKQICYECLRYVCCLSPHIFPCILYGILTWSYDRLPDEYGKKMVRKNALLKQQFQDLLGNDGVLIYPTFISPACYPYESFENIANISYMMIFNALGLPVTQCPMGLNRKGLPIGLQIVANPGCDHLTIAVAQEIERAFGGWQQPTREKTV